MKFKELLLLAKVGDETAITAFIEHYKPMLDRICPCPTILTVIADQTAGELMGCLVGVPCPYLQFQLFIGFLILHTDRVKVLVFQFVSPI